MLSCCCIIVHEIKCVVYSWVVEVVGVCVKDFGSLRFGTGST